MNALGVELSQSCFPQLDFPLNIEPRRMDHGLVHQMPNSLDSLTLRIVKTRTRRIAGTRGHHSWLSSSQTMPARPTCQGRSNSSKQDPHTGQSAYTQQGECTAQMKGISKVRKQIRTAKQQRPKSQLFPLAVTLALSTRKWHGVQKLDYQVQKHQSSG